MNNFKLWKNPTNSLRLSQIWWPCAVGIDSRLMALTPAGPQGYLWRYLPQTGASDWSPGLETGGWKAASPGAASVSLMSPHLFSPSCAYSDRVPCKDAAPAAPQPPGLLCEWFLPRPHWSPVAAERPGRGGWGHLHGPDPEWRLDLPDPGDAGNRSPEWGGLHLPSAASEPDGSCHHGVEWEVFCPHWGLSHHGGLCSSLSIRVLPSPHHVFICLCSPLLYRSRG